MGEDLGEIPEPAKKKQRGHGPRVYQTDGSISQKIPGACKYTSRCTKVPDLNVLLALDCIYRDRMTLVHKAGIGHKYNGVRYAQFHG